MPKSIAASFLMMISIQRARQTATAFASGHFTRMGVRRNTVISMKAFQIGESVEIVTDEGSVITGKVHEVRGSGWYSIQLPSRRIDDDSFQYQTIRGTYIRRSLATTTIQSDKLFMTDNGNVEKDADSTSSILLPPPPSIIDLDELLQSSDSVIRPENLRFLNQVKHHAAFTKWIMFTDLHCSPSSLDTCLQVLDFVHGEAVRRNAGILFLGDWWHHRGTLRVDMLNSILETLASWTQPMVMIPGNHDQVTLGGSNHGLTPLQNAYTCPDSNIPGPLIFSHPTIFCGALFVPHIRDNATLETVLQSLLAINIAKAIFCHADVTGASMNDRIISQGGVLPKYFPAGKPIYSGHFHKPHTVSTADITIEYIGSPYEVSFSEAHQEKQILVLDTNQNWAVTERIPLDIGQKHFKAESIEEFIHLQEKVKDGDRVILSLKSEVLLDLRRNEEISDSFKLEMEVDKLRKVGASVEIREVKTIPIRPISNNKFHNDTQKMEDMSPSSTLSSYMDEEVSRGSISVETAKELLRSGMDLLGSVEVSREAQIANSLVDIEFTSVSLEGFGPFKDPVTYPLASRGLVLLRGSNQDGGSDSNGTGKTTLAMATLWGLTGSVDPRLVSDSKVADVVTDGCKYSKVIIKGMLNGKDFQVVRTKTTSKSGLNFYLGGKDFTAQSARDTQSVIEETLGINLQVLSRTVFQGQHAVNGLLEATDAKLKEEMGFIVPLTIWQHASNVARAYSRDANKIATELNGMIKLRDQDVCRLQEKRDEALRIIQSKKIEFDFKNQTAHKVYSPQSNHLSDVASIQNELMVYDKEISELQIVLQEQKQEKERELRGLMESVNLKTNFNDDAKKDYLKSKFNLEISSSNLESANDNLKNIELKWNVDLSSENTPTLDIVKCPTCQQSLFDKGVDSHVHVRQVFENDVKTIILNVNNAQDANAEATQNFSKACDTLKSSEHQLSVAVKDVEEAQVDLREIILSIERKLDDARSRHAHLSSQLQNSLSNLKTDSETQAIKSSLEIERTFLEFEENKYSQLNDDVEDAEKALMTLKKHQETELSKSSTFSRLSEVFGGKGIQNFVMQNAIDALQALSQAYLDELSDGSLRLLIRLDTSDKIERRALVRLPNGEFLERPLSSLSGGQWRRCALALNFGFLDLISRKGRLRSSLLVMDEPLTHLDRNGRNQLGLLLRKILDCDSQIGGLARHGISVGTIILILQDLAAEELEEAFDQIDEVVKQKGYSAVILDEKDEGS